MIAFSMLFMGWLGVYGYGTLLLQPEALLPPPALARTGDAARYLPQTTIGFLSMVDSASLLNHVAQTQFWKLVSQSPEVQAELRRKANDFSTEMKRENLDLLLEVRRTFSGPITLALLDFEPEQAKTGQPLRLALFAELATGTEEVARKLLGDKVLPRLLETDGPQAEDVTSGPFPYTRLRKDQKIVGALAVLEGRFVLVTHEPDLAALAAPASAALAQSPQLQQVQAEIQKADFSFFVNLPRLLERVRPALVGSDAQALQALLHFGLSDLGTALYTATAAREGYIERLSLSFPPDSKTPLVQLLNRLSTSKLRSVQQTPPSSTFLLATNFGSVSDLFQDYLKILAQDGTTTPEQVRQDLAATGQDLGIGIEKDVIEQLSGEFALALRLPSVSGQVLDNPMLALGYLADSYFSVFLGVNDEKRADETARKLLASAEVTITTEPYRGVSISYLTSSSPLPVIPTYTLHDGLLAFHLNAGTAKACIDARLDGKDLRSDADFQRSLPDPAFDTGASLSYLRLSALAPLLVRLGRSDVERDTAQRDAATKQAELQLLGQLETLSGKLYGFTTQSRVQPGLFVHESYAPIAASSGVGMFSGAGSLLGITLAFSSMGTAAEPPVQTEVPVAEPVQEEAPAPEPTP